MHNVTHLATTLSRDAAAAANKLGMHVFKRYNERQRLNVCVRRRPFRDARGTARDKDRAHTEREREDGAA